MIKVFVLPNRWRQLLFGIICMSMIANLQYGWTLFVNPIHDQQGWDRAAIQIAFTVFVITETWLVPIEGWFVDRYGPRIVVMFGGALVGKFYKKFYQGKAKGIAAAGIMSAKAFLSAATGSEFSRELFSPTRARMRIDDTEVPARDYTLLLASTITSHLGIKVTYRAKEQPGRFHLVASGGTNLELVRQFHDHVVRPRERLTRAVRRARPDRASVCQERDACMRGQSSAPTALNAARARCPSRYRCWRTSVGTASKPGRMPAARAPIRRRASGARRAASCRTGPTRAACRRGSLRYPLSDVASTASVVCAAGSANAV